jgi:hypothetical protein
MTNTPANARALALRLFALSFIALFLELMVIRWVPAVVRLVAYYSNLMLISSFLGLGVGVLMSARPRRLFGWFHVVLAANITFLLLCRYVVMPGSNTEHRFFQDVPLWVNYLALIGIFAFNALMFVPLGQEIGSLFQALPPLRAYGWDLAGSLAGTLCFGLFSLYYFSPMLGMAGVMLVYLGLAPWRNWTGAVPLFALILAGMIVASDREAVWSPYYYITVRDYSPFMQRLGTSSGAAPSRPFSIPPEQLRTMKDPPTYEVSVNQDFYQLHGTLDRERYSPVDAQDLRPVDGLLEQYLIPYKLAPGRKRVAVMGAGGGMDVEAALLQGVKHVDAVEIDPVLIDLSRRLSAAGVYDDDRVTVYVNDARAFLRTAEPGYDLIVFGFLDSQALFSYMSNIRLDGFTYTVESLRSAYNLLGKDGVLAISFEAARPWLQGKLYGMVEAATGKPPLAYVLRSRVILCAFRGEPPHSPPAGFKYHERAKLDGRGIDLATDDWPYLYLSRKTIPADYLTVILVLLALSLIAVCALRGRGVGANDGHFLFLGWAFLLLETKSISDCSLYFGTTWFVTMIVIVGVLLMVLAANLFAMRLRQFSLLLYVPLFASLGVIYFVPRESILSLSFTGRLLWTLLAVPLPIFFAGLIFSTTFREGKIPAALLGANLIGAMIGGFSEYLGMAIGSQNLALLVVGTYGASFVCRLLGARSSATLASVPEPLPVP